MKRQAARHAPVLGQAAQRGELGRGTATHLAVICVAGVALSQSQPRVRPAGETLNAISVRSNPLVLRRGRHDARRRAGGASAGELHRAWPAPRPASAHPAHKPLTRTGAAGSRPLSQHGRSRGHLRPASNARNASTSRRAPARRQRQLALLLLDPVQVAAIDDLCVARAPRFQVRQRLRRSAPFAAAAALTPASVPASSAWKGGPGCRPRGRWHQLRFRVRPSHVAIIRMPHCLHSSLSFSRS
jgi:hypothetical protein